MINGSKEHVKRIWTLLSIPNFGVHGDDSMTPKACLAVVVKSNHSNAVTIIRIVKVGQYNLQLSYHVRSRLELDFHHRTETKVAIVNFNKDTTR